MTATLARALVEACGETAVGAARGSRPLQVRPGDGAAVASALVVCCDHGASVTVEGLAPPGGTDVLLDLCALDRVQVNAASHLVHAGAGVTVADLEDALQTAGFTLGAQEAPPVPLGAWLAAAEPGPGGHRAFPGWSPVFALSAVLLDGTPMETTLSPRSATGPDLKALLVGGRGRAGVITGAVLRIHATAEVRRRVTVDLKDHRVAVGVVCEALGRGLFPDALGIVDRGADGVTLAWESAGLAARTELVAAEVDDIAREAGAVRTKGPGAVGPGGVRERAAHDEAGAGVLAVCRWSEVEAVHAAVARAFPDAGRVHVERAFPEGAALFACAPGANRDRLREVVAGAGARLPGRDDDDWFYDAVGAVLRGALEAEA